VQSICAKSICVIDLCNSCLKCYLKLFLKIAEVDIRKVIFFSKNGPIMDVDIWFRCVHCGCRHPFHVFFTVTDPELVHYECRHLIWICELRMSISVSCILRDNFHCCGCQIFGCYIMDVDIRFMKIVLRMSTFVSCILRDDFQCCVCQIFGCYITNFQLS